MAIYGSLKTMDLGDVLQWLYLRGKTGILFLKIGDYEKKLVIREGKLRYAVSEEPGERLNTYLIKFANLTEKDIENALKISKHRKMPLEAVLLKSKKINLKKLEEVLTTLVKEIVYNSFTTEDGYFRFEERDENIPFELELEIQEMLLEGYARKDELSEIRRKIPNSEVRFLVKIPPTDDFLTLLDLGKSLREVADELQMVEFEALKRAYEHLEKGEIEPLGQIVYKEEIEEEKEDSFPKLKVEAEMFFREGRLREALAIYEKLLKIDPTNPDISRKIDEINRAIRIEDISDSAVPRLKVSENELSSLELSPQEGFVISRINGVWSLAEISKVCPFPPETTRGIIKILISKGIIEI